MLSISTSQMQALSEESRRRFVNEMVVHSRSFAARLCEVTGEVQLRIALEQIIECASGHGFTNRGPAQLCVEAMFLFGSGFDSDPQYPRLGQVLRAEGDQMKRADDLYEWIVDYMQHVSGADAANVHSALRNLSAFARKPIRFSESQFIPGMLRELSAIFPEKVAYLGERSLLTLLDAALVEAKQLGFDEVRAKALLVALKFAFGHDCSHDPLYPWIASTLQDERIVDAAARSQRLERKALTWLEHVLERQRTGAAT